MATKNLVPRADGEGEIGSSAKSWLKGWFGTVKTLSVTDGTSTATVADLASSVTLKHDAATAGTGISIAGQVVTNSDTGSVAVTDHEGTYDHSKLHDREHALDGTDHTVAGLTAGHALKATGTASFAFAALEAANIASGTFSLDRIPTPLTGKDADTLDGSHSSDFAEALHVLTGTCHSESGLTEGQYLKATGTASFGFAAIAAGEVASGTFSLDRIPTPLTGKDADTLDGSHSSDFAEAVHLIDGTSHSAAGLTDGDFLRATGTASIGFETVTAADVAALPEAGTSTDNAFTLWSGTAGDAVKNSLATMGTDGAYILGGTTTVHPGDGATNIEKLSGTKTLTATDPELQILDPNAASQIVYLPQSGMAAGKRFTIIANADGTSSNNLIVKAGSGAVECDNLYGRRTLTCRFDGTNWNFDTGSRHNASTGTLVAAADPYNVNIGKNAMAYYYAVAVGMNSKAQGIYATAIGPGAVAGGDSSTAIGSTTNAAGKRYSVALGYASSCFRYAEIAHCIARSTLVLGMSSNPGLYAETTTTTANQEIYCGGVSGQRYDIYPQSSLTFSLLINARDNVNNKSKGWRLEGGISREGTNAAALDGTVSKSVLSATAGTFTDTWDVQASASGTSLMLDVTPDTAVAKKIRWTATGMCAETRFA